MNWCSQREHACVNYGYIENLNAKYFKHVHHFILDESLIGAIQTVLYPDKTYDIETLTLLIADIRRWWTYTPQLSREAMEQSTLSITECNTLIYIASVWLGNVDVSTIQNLI